MYVLCKRQLVKREVGSPQYQKYRQGKLLLRRCWNVCKLTVSSLLTLKCLRLFMIGPYKENFYMKQKR